MKPKFLPSIIFLLIAVNTSFAQHHNIRQWQANYSYTNPAFTGIAINPRISASYQQIFPAILAGRNTYKLDYDQRISPKAGAVGVSLLKDVTSHIVTRFAAGLQYAYEFKLSDEMNLRTGASLAYVNLDVDTSKIISASKESFTDKKGGHYGFGAMLTYKNIFAGIAAHNFTRELAPVNSLGKIALISDYTAQLGGFFPTNKSNPKSTIIAPYFIVYGKPRLIGVSPGVNVNKGIFTGGLCLRTNNLGDALAFLAGVSKGWVKTGYTYDLGIPDARGIWAGSHELTFTIYPGKLHNGSENGIPYYFRKMGF